MYIDTKFKLINLEEANYILIKDESSFKISVDERDYKVLADSNKLMKALENTNFFKIEEKNDYIYRVYLINIDKISSVLRYEEYFTIYFKEHKSSLNIRISLNDLGFEVLKTKILKNSNDVVYL